MKSYRPLFGTILIGLIAMLVGGGALLSAFGHNLFFEARFSFAWIVVGLLVVSAIMLLLAAFWPRKEVLEGRSASQQPTGTGENMSPKSTADFDPQGGSSGVHDFFGAATSPTNSGDFDTAPATQSYARTASFGTPVTAIERRFVPVTDDDARQGASSEGGSVLADLRWLEPNGEQVSVPLRAKEGSIDLLVNADSSLAIHMAMGNGTVTVDPALGLHPAGRTALGGTLPSDVHLLLGRDVAEAGDATLVVKVESVSADLRISAM